mmetsp:Transcript_11700/g.28380  ORF Transcript_11700/g.28380 Transcript_11700/m.28380 type:complete len:87 (+) Transcript_11700:48-308(+)
MGALGGRRGGSPSSPAHTKEGFRCFGSHTPSGVKFCRGGDKGDWGGEQHPLAQPLAHPANPSKGTQPSFDMGDCITTPQILSQANY